MRYNKFELLFFIFMFAIMIGGFAFTLNQKIDCDKVGGLLVRGYSWKLECVQPKELK